MRFVKLTSVDDSFEANFLKEDLGEEGIACMVTNENITTLIPHMNGIMGSGIQVMVTEQDLVKAQEVLRKRQSVKSLIICPACDSVNIHFGLGTTNRFRRIVSIVISVVTSLPFGNISNVYYCRDCRTEFRK